MSAFLAFLVSVGRGAVDAVGRRLDADPVGGLLRRRGCLGGRRGDGLHLLLLRENLWTEV